MDGAPKEHEGLQAPILSVRASRVIMDADLARIYGVTTSALNQAVRRNADRFPEDFAFRLSFSEVTGMRLAISPRHLQPHDLENEIVNPSQAVTGSQKHRDPRKRPWAFTEHGALMAANVLRSKRAVQMSVYVVRAFVRVREQAAANVSILKRLAEIDRTLLQHDTTLRELYRKLLPLLTPVPGPGKRRIGF
jgi:hypothetical protein